MFARIEFGSKTVTETRLLPFDFSSYLGTGETISSAIASCAVWSGTDPAPAGIISGGSTISGAIVTQLVTAGVIGVLYIVQMTATTSLGQILPLGGFLAVVAGQPG